MSTNESKNYSQMKMFLMFEKQGELPTYEALTEKLKAKGYTAEVPSETPSYAELKERYSDTRVFNLPEYTIEPGGDMPPLEYQIMMFCMANKENHGDDLSRTQFWQTPNGAELIDASQWEVMIGDNTPEGYPHQMRAQILYDWLEAALDLFPDCTAVWFEDSQNVVTADELRNNPYEGARRIFDGAVNVRMFEIEDTDEIVVDTLGLQVFGLPDVQVHFKGLDTDDVIGFVYDLALYQFENDCPIQDGDNVDGFGTDHEYHDDIQWTCQYEDSILEPKRPVLDVRTGANAAGDREPS